MRLSIKHRWDVKPCEAREIQEDLRKKWEGSDRLGAIRTVAGLDAAFVLKGSQAFKRKSSRWNALHEANRAIGGVVVFAYPEMIEVERAFAEMTLSVDNGTRVPRPTREADRFVSEVKERVKEG
jgi:deoxyinosine 3'endonuclease (endonuclease V)